MVWHSPIRWEGHIPDSAYEPFAGVISGLTVALIATDVDQLETCRFEERVRDVQVRSSGFADDYDHLPVVSNGTFCGFLAVKQAGDDEDRVRDSGSFLPLSSDLLIGADTPILSVLDPPSGMPWERPRLVVSGSGIVGLVTAEDLLKPPSELVLGALMLEMERRMIRRVERTEWHEERWWALCCDDERQNWEHSGRALSLIYYTGFPTKLKILKEMAILELTSRERGRLIGLRNALFHARFPAQYDPDKIQRAIECIHVALAQLGNSGERPSPLASEMPDDGPQ